MKPGLLVAASILDVIVAGIVGAAGSSPTDPALLRERELAAIKPTAAEQTPLIGSAPNGPLNLAAPVSCAPWLKYTSPTSQTLLGIGFSGNRYVAVGGYGVTINSTDGVTWRLNYSPVNKDLSRIAWNGTLFVVVGEDGVILSSADGLTWTQRGSPTAQELRGIAWGGSRFVAAGRGGTLITSTDGIAWSAVQSPTTKDIFAVTARQGRFVAIDDDGWALVSDDGLSWNRFLLPAFPAYGTILGLGSNATFFIGVGFEVNLPNPDQMLIYTSANGMDWTRRSAPQGLLRGVTSGSEKVVAVGDSAIVESADGYSWTSVSSPLSGRIWDVVWGTNQFVAVGAGGIALSTCTIQPTTTSYWVPVASHAPGLLGSQWRTDLGILNRSGSTANIEVRLNAGGTVVTNSSYVPAGAQSILVDAVGQLGVTGAGAIELRSDQAVMVSSRTYNQSPSGTFGQNYPTFAAGEGLTTGQSAYLTQLSENAAYRTNIGITNIGASAALVTVSLFDGAGNMLNSYSVSLAPGEWKQETQPFKNRAGQTAMDRGYARITVDQGSGVVGYAALIDNITNDPTTMEMIR